MNIKTGDNVKVLAGKDRGQTGKVVQILTKEERIVVDGVNKMKKNVRPRREGEKGQVVEYNGPIHVSNVLLVCPKCNKATRIKISRDKNGEKTRICSKCEANI
jgi:large subunit ribosomal protein L24